MRCAVFHLCSGHTHTIPTHYTLYTLQHQIRMYNILPHTLHMQTDNLPHAVQWCVSLCHHITSHQTTLMIQQPTTALHIARGESASYNSTFGVLCHFVSPRWSRLMWYAIATSSPTGCYVILSRGDVLSQCPLCCGVVRVGVVSMSSAVVWCESVLSQCPLLWYGASRYHTKLQHVRLDHSMRRQDNITYRMHVRIPYHLLRVVWDGVSSHLVVSYATQCSDVVSSDTAGRTQ